MNGKRRTREHVISDLSVNYVEGLALRAGFTAERTTFDYGMDLLLSTYNGQGETEPGYVYMQLKATDHLSRLRGGRISVQVDDRDLKLWMNEFHPVVFVLYDAARNVAYWLHIQAYFASNWKQGAARLSTLRTVHFGRGSRMRIKSMMHFAELKRRMYAQLRGR